MSFISTFNYNRDKLTEGAVVGYTGSPIYGSSISFESDVSYWRGDNFNSHLMARGLNNIKATMDFTFQGDKDSMKSLIHRLEEATTGAVTGDEAFSGEFNSIHFGEDKNGITINLDTDYYNNFSGSQVSNYSLKPVSDNIYEISLNLFNNRLSPILNNGMAFIFDKTKSINNVNFEKFDIATGSTGDCNSNVFDNYFYLTEDKVGSITASNVSGLNTYTGVSESSTRTFFWEPDQQISVPVDHQNRINQFKKSFHQSLNISKNQNRLNEVQLIFSNRTMEETYSMLHFFESHLGYKNFVYYIGDDIINPKRVFFCPRWKHTFNYKNSNTIEATFVEIVVPVEPKF